MHRYIYNTGQLFSKIAEENSGRVALKYPDGSIVSFEQLEHLSNRIANFFTARGLKKGDVIAIFNNKSPLGYCCMLAALKTGIIYTNLDLTSPYQRIKKIIERGQRKLLLFDIDCDLKNEVAELGIATEYLFDNFIEKLQKHAPVIPASTNDVTGADGAYIMFTHVVSPGPLLDLLKTNLKANISDPYLRRGVRSGMVPKPATRAPGHPGVADQGAALPTSHGCGAPPWPPSRAHTRTSSPTRRDARFRPPSTGRDGNRHAVRCDQQRSLGACQGGVPPVGQRASAGTIDRFPARAQTQVPPAG